MGWLQSCCTGKIWLQIAPVIVRLSVAIMFNIMRAVPLFLKQDNLLLQCVMCWSSFIWLRPVLHLSLPCSGRPVRGPPCSLRLLAVRDFWLGLTDKSHQQRKGEEKEGRGCFLLPALVEGGCISLPMSGSRVGLQGFISHFCCLLGLENNSVVICCVASKGTFTIPSWFPSVLPLFLLWIPFLKRSQLPRFHLAWFLLGKHAQMFRMMIKALRYLDHHLQLSP